MVILDSSFLFAYFRRNDEFHERAKNIAERIREELLYVSFLVIQELMTLITSRISSEAALEVYQNMFSENSEIKLLKIDEEYFDETLSLFKKLSLHRFSFVDVSLIVLSKELDAQVLTFDQRLEATLNAKSFGLE